MKRLLSICPSRGRPELLKEMLQSFDANKSEGTDIVIYVSEEDPRLEDYKPILKDYNHQIGPKKYLVEVANMFSVDMYPDYEFYQLINDDHFVITPHFDELLMRAVRDKGHGWGVCTPNDLLTDWARWQHPSAEVVSGNIIRTLGYYIYPRFQHMGCDDYMQMMSQSIRRLWRLNDVVIEHRHWVNNRRNMDDNYKWAYSDKQQVYGMRILDEYKRLHYATDIQKLKDAMKAEGVSF